MRVSNNRRPRGGGRTNSGNNRSGANPGRSNNNSNRRTNNGNRNYDSTGPDGKIRGTASQVYDKYVALATDAQTSGDRVAAENYFQHAEHYFRIVAANNLAKQEKMAEQQANQQEQTSRQDSDISDDKASVPEQDATKRKSPDLSAAEQPDVNLVAGEENTGDINIEITKPVSSDDAEEEKPKRRTSRTRTLRRKTSSRSEETKDTEEVSSQE
jgi:hypothetical protein